MSLSFFAKLRRRDMSELTNENIKSSLDSMASLIDKTGPKENIDKSAKAQKLVETANIISDTLLAMDFFTMPNPHDFALKTASNLGQPSVADQRYSRVAPNVPSKLSTVERTKRSVSDSKASVSKRTNAYIDQSLPSPAVLPTFEHIAEIAIDNIAKHSARESQKVVDEDFFDYKAPESSRASKKKAQKDKIESTRTGSLLLNAYPNPATKALKIDESTYNALLQMQETLQIKLTQTQAESDTYARENRLLQAKNQELQSKISVQAEEIEILKGQNDRLRDELQKPSEAQTTQRAPFSLEIKALLDQNEMLRNENRKLMQSEREALEKIDKLAYTEPVPEAQSSTHLALKEKVLLELEEHIAAVSERKTHLFGTTQFGIRQFENLLACTQSLRTFVNMIGVSVDAKQLVEMCQGLGNLLFTTSNDTWQIVQEMTDLDDRVTRLRQDADFVRTEAQETITQLQLASKKELDAANLKLGEFVTQTEKLGKDLEASHKEIARLGREASSAQCSNGQGPQLIAVPEYIGNDRLKAELEAAYMKIHSLSSHITQVELDLESWAHENKSLRRQLDEQRHGQGDNNEERLLRRISTLESELESEKVQSKKAERLIESLSAQARTRPEERDQDLLFLEKTISKQIELINSKLGGAPEHAVNGLEDILASMNTQQGDIDFKSLKELIKGSLGN